MPVSGMTALALSFVGFHCLGTMNVEAAPWCHPRDSTARVLASLYPNDLHEDWRGQSKIGTAWALAPKRRIVANDVGFIEGDL